MFDDLSRFNWYDCLSRFNWYDWCNRFDWYDWNNRFDCLIRFDCISGADDLDVEDLLEPNETDLAGFLLFLEAGLYSLDGFLDAHFNEHAGVLEEVAFFSSVFVDGKRGHFRVESGNI